MIKQPYVCQTLWESYPITGKVELVYEGEGAYVAQNLIASAIHTFSQLLSKIEKLEKPDAKTPILI
jgi:hypothetical protein